MDPAIKLIMFSVLMSLAGYGLLRSHRVFESFKNQTPLGRSQPLPFIRFMKWLAIGLGVVFIATAVLLLVTAIWALWSGTTIVS